MSEFWINGQKVEAGHYWQFHARRIEITLEKLAGIGARRVLELGSHPWHMTAALVNHPRLELAATVSAEEVIQWPDEIPLRKTEYTLRTGSGRQQSFPNYSVNLERTLFDLEEEIDTVLACEIVEHLVRAPHVLFLNANHWLNRGGKLLVTTPNGAQFSNPFRRKTPTAGYRSHIYERHHYLFTRPGLEDLVRLCGFRIVQSGYWNVYPYQGLSRVYRPLTRLPWKYFQDKFQKTVFVLAEKEKTVHSLSRVPQAYHSDRDWEWIDTTVETAEGGAA